MAEKTTRPPQTETQKASTPSGRPERKASDKLDKELEHTFPGSDPPSTTDPSRKVIDDKLRAQAPEVPGVPPEAPPTTPPPETPPVELPPQPGPPVEAPPRGPAQTPPSPQAGKRK